MKFLKCAVLPGTITVLLITGCIRVPVYEHTPVIIPSAVPAALPQPPYDLLCHDPTRGLLVNPSLNITYRVWRAPVFGADGEPQGAPTVVIPPKGEAVLHLHPAANRIHYRGSYPTALGTLGVEPQSTEIRFDSSVRRGCYGWTFSLPTSGRYRSSNP
ncbi:MAG: hypothetical protein Q8R13_05340 [bacterium]|nr:hypothetical protein [bacterium]MDZ4296504.1 hypothetical protein [Patescibacteria group bacterium]